MMTATDRSYWRIVLLLVLARAHLNLRERRFGWAALRLACVHRQMPLLRTCWGGGEGGRRYSSYSSSRVADRSDVL